MSPCLILIALLAASPSGAPPVVAMTADQALAAINAAWLTTGEPRFAVTAARDPLAVIACSGEGLCVRFVGSQDRVQAVELTGPATTREGSRRYLSAQSLLVRLTAPGAPVLPVVTADRVAVGGLEPAEAQLGPTCMRVQRSVADMLSTTFLRRRCSVDRAPGR